MKEEISLVHKKRGKVRRMKNKKMKKCQWHRFGSERQLIIDTVPFGTVRSGERTSLKNIQLNQSFHVSVMDSHLCPRQRIHRFCRKELEEKKLIKDSKKRGRKRIPE